MRAGLILLLALQACTTENTAPQRHVDQSTAKNPVKKVAAGTADDNQAGSNAPKTAAAATHNAVTANDNAAPSTADPSPAQKLSANAGDTPDDSAAPAKIPATTCTGSGTLHNPFGDYDWHRTDALGGTTAMLTTTVADVGSSDSDVNQNIQSMKGTTDYTLLPGKTSNLPIDQRFMMVSNAWTGVTLDKPLPVSVFPAKTLDRYAALQKGPISFSATANGSIPINATVALGQASGDTVVINFTYDIPGATGKTWEAIRLPKAAAVTITLSAGKITAISSTTIYHDSHGPCGSAVDSGLSLPTGFGPCADPQMSEIQTMELVQQCN